METLAILVVEIIAFIFHQAGQQCPGNLKPLLVGQLEQFIQFGLACNHSHGGSLALLAGETGKQFC